MEPTLLDYYKAIENASQKMLEAAQTENWDQVVRLESTCAVLIAQLRGKARTLHGSLDGHAAQVMRGQRSKVALQRAHGRARGTGDDDGVLVGGGLRCRHGGLLF